MADVKKKIKTRQGHRTFVEGVVGKSRELIAAEITEEVCQKLQVNKRILEGKITLFEWKLERFLKTFNKELQLREKCALFSGGSQRKDQQYNQKEREKYIHYCQPTAASLLTESKNVQQSRKGSEMETIHPPVVRLSPAFLLETD